MPGAKISAFKKFPVIVLPYKDKNGVERKFSFGLVKARLVLDNLADIKVFVETNGGAP